MTSIIRCSVLLATFVLLTFGHSQAGENKGAYFTDKVRPILVQHCLQCHGPDKTKGGLDLSRRETLLEGGNTGAVVLPGKATTSLLLHKVKAGKMPPSKPLSPLQVAVLEKWINEGATYVGEPLVVAKAAGQKVPWSFQPVAQPIPPQTKFDKLAKNTIDRFVFAKHEEKGLSPAAPADKLVLLRRVTFDLTGLPPTTAEIDVFLKDDGADAYEKVVDRLLASDAYGERWARHWLDVVRFGESHGYEQNHIRANAWPYRDYVIRAFNDDKPYDQFVLEQLAGDVVGTGDTNIEAATGFLVAGVHDTVGNSAEQGRRQQRADDLEDMVATTGAAFLGLTLGCARCHDHKFDPVPQMDFYQLAAVFAGVRHAERPLAASKAATKVTTKEAISLHQLVHMMRELRGKIADLDAAARARLLATQGVSPVPRPAVHVRRNVDTFEPIKAKFVRFTVQATRDGSQPCLDELEIFGPDDHSNLGLSIKGAKARASSLLPGHRIHQVEHLNDGRFGNEWSWISNESGKGWVEIELAQAAVISRIVWGRDSGLETIYQDRLASKYYVEVSLDGKDWRQVANGDDRAAATEAIPEGLLLKHLTKAELAERDDLLKALSTLKIVKPAPAYIGVFNAPDPIYLLKRGDVMQRGDLVGPGALSQVAALSGTFDAAMLKTEPDRRLALARWITHPKNPLTARVLVNRLWQHHFGRGLVATPSDFGNNGATPTHPELLDWLAQDFMSHGWKMKRLHKLMVTSYAYRQATQVTDKGKAVDADNQYLWRMPLRRLEAEALRDAILAVSGALDRKMGGPGFLLFKYRVVNVAIYEPLEEHTPATWRRTIYAVNARAIREPLLASFDCPESALRAPRREVTITALQALSLLNDPFIVQQAKLFAERVTKEAGADVGRQVDLAFRSALGRLPDERERAVALDVVRRHGLATLGRVLLNTNEFLYY